MLTLANLRKNKFSRQLVVRTAAVSFLLGVIWVYLAVVFSPIWVPYKFAVSANRLSHNLGIF
ncbi:MAG: hypothetical protein UW86_C0009G0006 [Microgenomates group bacterium GW2011_GWA1_Microgenomates_45_10]|nr:MAG: hypothetical protein UW73_C0022G0006 [Microgenomates group bacterium GW2011_GWB1_44_8]KKT87103.1 MAG: hypothetical protein UW86_C0009G0006 [Microgenomates group bacterium GW2011_GWA1_Microgenomates_45_10]